MAHRAHLVRWLACVPLALSALDLRGAATGEEPPHELDPFHVIAHPSGADERTASVWIVAPEPGELPAIRTADLLQQVPGVHVDRAGGPGGRSTIYLRGTEENHTLVLLDGVPLNDLTDSRGGGVDVSGIDPSLITNLAVVRGAASVRHGPEVLGGIAHLETVGGRAPFAHAGVEIGGDDYRRAYGTGVIESVRGTRFSFGGSGMDEGSIADGGRTRLRFVRAALSLPSPADLQLGVWHGRHEADAFPDDSGGKRLAVVRSLEHRDERRTGVALRASSAANEGKWTFTADAAQFDTTIDTPGVAPGLRDPAGLPLIVSDTRLRRARVSLVRDWSLAHGSFAAGIDGQHERGRDDSEIDFGGFAFPTDFSLTRTRGGVFTEGTLQTGKDMLLLLGARLDRFEEGYSRGTVRAGILRSIDEGRTQWRLNAGTAFKPPSFYALAHPIVGNPDLKPESVRTVEAGWRHAFENERGLVDLTIFHTRTRNAVDFDAGPPPRVVNIDGLTSRGAELALRLPVGGRVSWMAAATWMDARAEPDGARMRSRPRWRGNLGLNWRPVSTFSISGDFVAVGNVPDSSIPTGEVRLGGWARIDVAARWSFSRKAMATLAVDNLLDRRYEEVVGFPAQRRRLRVGLQAGF